MGKIKKFDDFINEAMSLEDLKSNDEYKFNKSLKQFIVAKSFISWKKYASSGEPSTMAIEGASILEDILIEGACPTLKDAINFAITRELESAEWAKFESSDLEKDIPRTGGYYPNNKVHLLTLHMLDIDWNAEDPRESNEDEMPESAFTEHKDEYYLIIETPGNIEEIKEIEDKKSEE